MFSRSKNEKGQGLVEYAIILALVAVVVIAAMQVLGPKVGNTFSSINTAMDGGVPQLDSSYIFSVYNDMDNPTADGCNAIGGTYTWGNGSNGVGCYFN